MRVNDGACEPTAGSSPMVCTGVPLKAVLAMVLVYHECLFDCQISDEPARTSRGESAYEILATMSLSKDYDSYAAKMKSLTLAGTDLETPARFVDML